MAENYFGSQITRYIWSNQENIILIFAGTAADFALNPSVDWLFFTGEIPSHPQLRFIETFAFNRMLFFSNKEKVPQIVQQIMDIHKHVETKRSVSEGPHKIPNEAFIQVSDMLIEYGIRGYEYLHHTKLTDIQKDTYYQDIKKIDELMHIQGLDDNYEFFLIRRNKTVSNELNVNKFTPLLYKAYENDIGIIRYKIFLNFQSYFINPAIAYKLNLKKHIFFQIFYTAYPYIRNKLLLLIIYKLFLKKETIIALKRYK